MSRAAGVWLSLAMFAERLFPGGRPPEGGIDVFPTADPILSGRLAAARADRPWVAINMVATADGAATVRGSSNPISCRADRANMRALRARVDAVLVGARTLGRERYGRLVRSRDDIASRVGRGWPEQPLAVIVSAGMNLDPDTPLLRDPASRPLVFTPSDRPAPAPGIAVERIAPGDWPRAVLGRLLRAHGVESLLCEGGPTVNGALLAAGLVDELLVTISPKLASGSAARIVRGPELDPPLDMELVAVDRADSFLLLRYRIASAPRAATENVDLA